jgi:GTP-binding protein
VLFPLEEKKGLAMRIIDASFARSVTEIGQRKLISLPEVCFFGRSNVGKSSLLNTLAARKIAKTGGTPGVTRLINLYTIVWERGGRRGSALFSDFPGFGYSKVSRNLYEGWQAMVESYMAGNEWVRRALWVFDIRRTFDRLDMMLLDWLRAHRLEFSLVLTKADKEARGVSLQKKQAFQTLLGREEVFLFSAKDGYGKRELLLHIGPSLTEKSTS